MKQHIRVQLQQGVAQLLSPARMDLVEALLAYLKLLQRWNRIDNLTAIREPAEMVRRHLLDSLAVHPYVEGSRLLDVGSGAGLPGIPLALAEPWRTVVLLDSNAKKARFLRQVVIELALPQVTVVQARIEDYRSPERFDTIIARAFAQLPAFYHHARPLLAPAGRVLAMKGREPASELQSLAGEGVAWESHRLAVPGLDAERRVIILEPPAAGEAQ